MNTGLASGGWAEGSPERAFGRGGNDADVVEEEEIVNGDYGDDDRFRDAEEEEYMEKERGMRANVGRVVDPRRRY